MAKTVAEMNEAEYRQARHDLIYGKFEPAQPADQAAADQATDTTDQEVEPPAAVDAMTLSDSDYRRATAAITGMSRGRRLL